jgi:NTP pyrophosphatase (non-canonical NTP hydrolase)
MELSKLQETVDQWITEHGVRYFNELTNTALLMEEVGEVARLMARKYGEQSFKENEHADSLADELADVLFVLVCIANQTGINLTDSMQKNLDKKSKRDKERHLNNPKLSRP